MHILLYNDNSSSPRSDCTTKKEIEMKKKQEQVMLKVHKLLQGNHNETVLQVRKALHPNHNETAL